MMTFEAVELEPEVEVVVTRFRSFGGLAHLRRSLLALPQVTSARIISYSGFTAFFSVAVVPGTRAGTLALPGTRLVNADSRRVELRFDIGAAAAGGQPEDWADLHWSQ